MRVSALGLLLIVCLVRTGHGSIGSRHHNAVLPRNIIVPHRPQQAAPRDSSLTLDNGLAGSPPLGWISGQRFVCITDCENYPDDCISEKLIKSTADVLSSPAYKAAGFQYVSISDCWSSSKRDEQGQLAPNATRFPSGMKALADYVHSKGLLLGLHLDVGPRTCHGYPGSQGNLSKDAQTLAGWHVDMVHLDACTADPKTLDQDYVEMGKQLNATGRAMMFYCNWPLYQEQQGIKVNYQLVAKTCNMWQTYKDMETSWESLLDNMKHFGNYGKDLVNYTHSGSWSIMGQVLVGTSGLSYNQQRMQMALWSVASSPLLVSADIRKMDPDSKKILLSPLALAINQYNGSSGGTLIKTDGQTKYWRKSVGPLGDLALAITYENISGGPKKVSIKLSDIGFITANAYLFTDVFSGKGLGAFKPWHTFNCEVNPTGVVFIHAKALP